MRGGHPPLTAHIPYTRTYMTLKRSAVGSTIIICCACWVLMGFSPSAVCT